MARICHFIFLPCPEPPMGLSGVGSFPVWSGGYLIFSSSFRSWKSVLNRINYWHLSVVLGAFCLVWQAYGRLFGMSVCPHLCLYSHASIRMPIKLYVCLDSTFWLYVSSVCSSLCFLVCLHGCVAPICLLCYLGFHPCVGQACRCLSLKSYLFINPVAVSIRTIIYNLLLAYILLIQHKFLSDQ